MADEVASLAEHKVAGLEVIRVQGSTNQVNGSDQVLLDNSVLE